MRLKCRGIQVLKNSVAVNALNLSERLFRFCCMSVKEPWTNVQGQSWFSELDTTSSFAISKIDLTPMLKSKGKP